MYWMRLQALQPHGFLNHHSMPSLFCCVQALSEELKLRVLDVVARYRPLSSIQNIDWFCYSLALQALSEELKLRVLDVVGRYRSLLTHRTFTFCGQLAGAERGA